MNNTTLQTPKLVVANFHHRIISVSATADTVIPPQLKQFCPCLLGGKLSRNPALITYRQAIALCPTQPENRPLAIWYVRRNLEMAASIFARDALRLLRSEADGCSRPLTKTWQGETFC